MAERLRKLLSEGKVSDEAFEALAELEDRANRAESALRDLAANHLDLVVCPQGCYFRTKGSTGREKSWTSYSFLPSWKEWFTPVEEPK